MNRASARLLSSLLVLAVVVPAVPAVPGRGEFPPRFQPFGPFRADCLRGADLVFAGDLDSLRAERRGDMVFRRLYFHHVIWVRGGDGSDSARVLTPGGSVPGLAASADPDVTPRPGIRYVISARRFGGEAFFSPASCLWFVVPGSRGGVDSVFLHPGRVSEATFLEMLRDSIAAVEPTDRGEVPRDGASDRGSR